MKTRFSWLPSFLRPSGGLAAGGPGTGGGSSFRDRVALVTGAASGIGLSLCRQLADRGAVVVMADVQEASLHREARALEAGGARVSAHVLDVTDDGAFKALVEGVVERYGAIDLLFNNAGVGVGGEVRDFSYGDWKRVIDVNLYGVIHGIRAAYPVMIRQERGHIVNVASVAGLVPLAGEVSYTASKYAVVGLTHAMRAEAADLGVNVTLVCPGKIETPIYDTSPVVGFDKDKILDLWPQGVTPQVCAEQILRGVERNAATVVVTRLAKALWALHRVSPSIMLLAARKYINQAREFRVEETQDTGAGKGSASVAGNDVAFAAGEWS